MTVLSFHPIYEADRNRLCAGREPDDTDLSAIRNARAVILPQGCTRSLYEIANKNCRFVFPNYFTRFKFPGKIGQIRLFRKLGIPHPHTETFDTVDDFIRHPGRLENRHLQSLPLVFKFDWGGEGETVFLVESAAELEKMICRAQACENTGQRGFLVQEYVQAGDRVLRVAVIGRKLVSYWRAGRQPGRFAVNLSGGAVIDHNAEPHFTAAAEAAVWGLCRRTGINLAGFDLLFPTDSPKPAPLFLEINYFFGRQGLGGSQAYYRLLTGEITAWLESIDPLTL